VSCCTNSESESLDLTPSKCLDGFECLCASLAKPVHIFAQPGVCTQKMLIVMKVSGVVATLSFFCFSLALKSEKAIHLTIQPREESRDDRDSLGGAND
jgi:hypothetical protein